MTCINSNNKIFLGVGGEEKGGDKKRKTQKKGTGTGKAKEENGKGGKAKLPPVASQEEN